MILFSLHQFVFEYIHFWTLNKTNQTMCHKKTLYFCSWMKCILNVYFLLNHNHFFLRAQKVSKVSQVIKDQKWVLIFISYNFSILYVIFLHVVQNFTFNVLILYFIGTTRIHWITRSSRSGWRRCKFYCYYCSCLKCIRSVKLYRLLI